MQLNRPPPPHRPMRGIDGFIAFDQLSPDIVSALEVR